ncbi:uncharacterized protein (UPF0335 family) [Methylobacterium sp. RAS18]|nr:uncharacterized protein (UPF0335 family) [Methylobacterium sp. RAS18]
MNARGAPAPQVDPSSVAADQLKTIIERIERLEEEKAGIAGDVKDVYAEAKANGFDTKVIRKIIAMRKRDYDERMEEEAILELYMQALGMLADTPLGRAAAERDFGRGRVDAVARRAASAPSMRKAVQALGTPVPVTDAERKKGTVASFERDGMRMSIQIPRQTDIEDAIAARR